MDFSDALREMRQGAQVRRQLWRDARGRIGWAKLTNISPVGPVIVIVTAAGDTHLFACSQWDILAEDWEIMGT